MNYDDFLTKQKKIKCPHCKNKKWRHDSSKKVVAFLVENKNQPTNIVGTTPAFNFGFIECKNCGYVKLFSMMEWGSK